MQAPAFVMSVLNLAAQYKEPLLFSFQPCPLLPNIVFTAINMGQVISARRRRAEDVLVWREGTLTAVKVSERQCRNDLSPY